MNFDDPAIQKIIYGAAGVAATLIATLVKIIWSKNQSELTDLKAAVKENSRVTGINTEAILKLTIRMEDVKERLDIVSELRRDLDNLAKSQRVSAANQ